MITYCFDSKVDIFWNKKKQVENNIEVVDENGNTYIDPGFITKYEHGFAIVFELLDEEKKLVKFQVDTVIMSMTDAMLTVTEKMQILSSQELADQINSAILLAKQTYANYTLGV